MDTAFNFNSFIARINSIFASNPRAKLQTRLSRTAHALSCQGCQIVSSDTLATSKTIIKFIISIITIDNILYTLQLYINC